ncbi:MAG: helix-turn-helix domain-containing protein [Candidatus Thermoplasmatota archaeon]|jgi:DNA-binding transcriptional ArsR family regulator|nr:helix-turn-helix domain-containing protein [Candidatus Thermoplasmatota archaeon]MCL5786091.1 helix-turn-helix domain-containing protein [Candidatus Thermoplasmatota archaeon]
MFKMSVVSVPTRVISDDLDRNIAYFLSDIGYIPRLRPDTDFQTISRAAYFRLFKDCFVLNPSRHWGGEELMSYLNVSRTTLYRHLNKLKALDILEETQEGKSKKYRLRSGDLVRAWNWVEVNLRMAIENYRRTVERISEIALSGKSG